MMSVSPCSLRWRQQHQKIRDSCRGRHRACKQKDSPVQVLNQGSGKHTTFRGANVSFISDFLFCSSFSWKVEKYPASIYSRITLKYSNSFLVFALDLTLRCTLCIPVWPCITNDESEQGIGCTQIGSGIHTLPYISISLKNYQRLLDVLRWSLRLVKLFNQSSITVKTWYLSLCTQVHIYSVNLPKHSLEENFPFPYQYYTVKSEKRGGIFCMYILLWKGNINNLLVWHSWYMSSIRKWRRGSQISYSVPYD